MDSETRHDRVRSHTLRPKVGDQVASAELVGWDVPGEKGFLADAGRAASATELAETLHKTPVLLTTWTRCGKPTCRSASGEPHGPYHALYWREGGVQRRRYVRGDEVAAVAVLESRREQLLRDQREWLRARKTWRELMQLIEEHEAALRGEGGPA